MRLGHRESLQNSNTSAASTASEEKTHKLLEVKDKLFRSRRNDEDILVLMQKLQEFNRCLAAPYVQREEEAKIIILSLIANENPLFIGGVGMAKSDISLRTAKLLDAKFFKTQLNAFTEPPQILGPINIKKLKRQFRKPVYEHITTGMLPESEVAYVDEVFRGGKIRDILLSIMNEHEFFDGNKTVKVPIKALISATNFVSDEEEDQALFDRYLLRQFVKRVEKSKRPDLVDAGWEGEFGNSKKVENPVISISDLDKIHDYITKMDAHKLKERYLELLDKAEVTLKRPVSDRRITKVLKLAAANALLSGRTYVLYEDLSILKYVIPENYEEASKINGMLIDELSPTKYLKRIKELTENLSVGRERLDTHLSMDNDTAVNGILTGIDKTINKSKEFIEMTGHNVAVIDAAKKLIETAQQLRDDIIEKKRIFDAESKEKHAQEPPDLERQAA